MKLKSIITKLSNSNLITELQERTQRKDRLILNGTSKIGNSLLISSIARTYNIPFVIIVPSLDEAGKLLPIMELLGWNSTYIYPTSEGSLYDRLDTVNEIRWGQLQVLSELIKKDIDNDLCIVTTHRAFQPHLPPKELFEKRCLNFKIGQENDLNQICLQLSNIGYSKDTLVEQEGTWSRRGDIIDIFPVNNELPIRLEFFGDKLEKIREFDPSTQVSQVSIKDVFITPIGIEALIEEDLIRSNPTLLEEYKHENKIKINTNKGLNRLVTQSWNRPLSLADYLPNDSFIVLEDEDQCKVHIDNWIEQTKEDYILQKGDTNIEDLKKEPIILNSRDNVLDIIGNFKGLSLNCFNTIDSKNTHNVSHRNIDVLPNQFGKLSLLIKRYLKEKVSIFLLSAQPSRVIALLEEHECNCRFVINPDDYNTINSFLEDRTPVAIKCSSEAFLEGVYLPSVKILVLTDKEFFGQKSIINSSYIRRRKSSASRTIDTQKLHPGDYVVHRNHGVGQFKKIEKITIAGETRDYLVVIYLDGILRVAADQLASLSRYRASSEKSPKINKLGGTSWSKTKERARKGLRKVAFDLLKLYAEREKKSAYKYPEDGPWQKELEDSFPYEATLDQLSAIKEVKIDMERNKPMDRLICGDVGFGKTEIAIRAIFKAITAGKQIALLAPTTILAQQHWRTISERFAPYPINVSLLNRFKTSIERRKILENLESGKIDAIIGTHQLLNSRVKFSDLGLLVIDEEQRFGVNQKEKIKSFKQSVDVLTLSATPIPRTLYMSLSGVREMSLIKTPPPHRRSIKTNLAKMDDEVIRSAISQEIDRGGQIFYVVPRIEGIEKVAEKIRKMIPSLKLIVAHGQMNEGELESSMIAFNGGEADLLISTTIIESGLDIPRVNTIIIEDSHRFGLSQLYQLRGRVGRSGIQAYAWLFYPDNIELSDSARERLKAIQEFSSLGSGYQLSMRDMEIRGVGNLLGIEQSGQMEVIGFDMYMELLQEALADVQGQKITPVEETQVDLPITAFIPGDYIVDPDQKISAYKKASECIKQNQLIELATNWIDRYGPLPKAVETLLNIMKLKIRAKACGITRIKLQKPNIVMETRIDEPAFSMLRKGLPKHLHSRLIYKRTEKYSEIIVRGLGIMTNEKQVEQLTDWIEKMGSQITID